MKGRVKQPMFDYDKVIKKLNKLDELSKKKRKKVLDSVFTDEFIKWFYGVGDRDHQPPNIGTMVKNLVSTLARPKNLKILTKYVENASFDDFTRTDCCVCYVVIETAIEQLNGIRKDISSGYKDGEISGKTAKDYQNKTEEYNKLIEGLVAAIHDKSKPFVKKVSKDANLPRGFVMTTHFLVPEGKYIPKWKISGHMEQLLLEIYRYVGNNGMEYINSIKWHNYFQALFGDNSTASTALSIVLEGVRRIDPFRDAPHFDDVRAVWDSLTEYALRELDNAPEGVRRQMMDIYLKKVNHLFTDGNGARLRIDMLNIPSEYGNLARTMSHYVDRLAKIMHRNVDNFRNRNNRDDRRNNFNNRPDIRRDDYKSNEDEENDDTEDENTTMIDTDHEDSYLDTSSIKDEDDDNDFDDSDDEDEDSED